jgi:hypothetical protein
MIICKRSIDFLLVRADIDNDNILPLCACVIITVCVYNLLQSCFGCGCVVSVIRYAWK